MKGLARVVLAIAMGAYLAQPQAQQLPGSQQQDKSSYKRVITAFEARYRASIMAAESCQQKDLESSVMVYGDRIVDIGSNPKKIFHDGKPTYSIRADPMAMLAALEKSNAMQIHCHVTDPDDLILPSFADIINATSLLLKAKKLGLPYKASFRIVSFIGDELLGVDYWPNGNFKKLHGHEPYKPRAAESNGQDWHKRFRDFYDTANDLSAGLEAAHAFSRASEEFDKNYAHVRRFRKALEEQVGREVSLGEAKYAYLSASTHFQYRRIAYP